MNFSTKQIHTGRDVNAYGTSTEPLYACAAYQFPSSQSGADRFALTEAGNIYTRITNPSQSLFEQRVAALYNVDGCLALASGSAATFYAILTLCHAGDHIVAANNVYGGTFDLLKYTLPNLGITTTLVDPDDFEAFEAAIKPNTKILLVETMSNPSSKITDIEEIAVIADAHKIPLCVDNTFCGPYVYNPFEHGADLVVESATKFYSGNGTVMGGLLLESKTADWKNTYVNQVEESYKGVNFYTLGSTAFTSKARCCVLRDTGACISPWNAWMLHLGTRTMDLRIDRQCDNALNLAYALRKLIGIKSVSHPALTESRRFNTMFEGPACSIFTIELDADRATTAKFVDALKIWKDEANVGDSISIINQPAATTHSQLTEEELNSVGITGSTCRLSCGCEDWGDLYEDIVQALVAVGIANN